MRAGEMMAIGAALMLAVGLQPGAATAEDMVDPTTLTRPGTPNDWLVCPPGACAAEASEPAPVYEVSPQQLYEAWLQLLLAAPRTSILAADPARLILNAEDRTLVFRFVDSIAIRVLPAADGGVTFAAYSHSNTGYWDTGTNRRRLQAWIGQLGEMLK
ncbi:MAG: DUF1499 domain-containing protein [Geminicoccaceae bacterium]